MNNRSPAVAEAFAARVKSLVDAKAWAQVVAECEACRASGEDAPEVAFLRSIAAYYLDDYLCAVKEAERAFEGNPQVAEYAEWAAAAFVQVGDFPNSMYYAKMAAALPSDPNIRALRPDGLPVFAEIFLDIEEFPLMQKAIGAAAWGRWTEAESWFRQHIALEPRHRDGYLGLAQCLLVQGRGQSAVQILRAAMHNMAGDAAIASLLGQALTSNGMDRDAQAVHRWAMERAPEDESIAAAAVLDLIADSEREASALAGDVRSWGDRFGMKAGALGPVPRARRKGRLTVAFLMGAVGRRLKGTALAGILANFDRNRFRLVGFGGGVLTDGHNIVFQKALDAWHDIRDMDPFTFGAMVAAEDVDILIDVSGFWSPKILAGLGARVAPIQVAWMGAPLGTGVASFDGMLTDAFLVPEGTVPPFAERPLRMKTGCLPVDLPAGDLPLADIDDGHPPVFAADVSMAELTPRLVETWAGILAESPESPLVLYDHDFRDSGNTDRLISLFGTFGLAHRVDVVGSVSPVDFFAQADVALAPLAGYRPETVLNPLWAGIPVVAMAGDGVHRRESGSLLHHLGLGAETLAADVVSYRRLALGWAGDLPRRMAFRNGIRQRLQSSPVFDGAVRAKDLGGILDALWEEACAKAGG
ncbi:MAG: tetratricopeptide repeat protein [Magnetospirillum sp. WYHS-4]